MKISNDVADVLSNSRVEGNNLYLPDEQLERPLYMAVDKVLKAIQGQWNRKEKAHVFEYSPSDIVDEILLTGQYTCEKKEFQFFETPRGLAIELVSTACLSDTDTVLEPSAGHGAIIKAIGSNYDKTAIELNPGAIKMLTRCGVSGLSIIQDDFLNTSKCYDVIIANPPFTRQQDIDHVTHMLECANRKVVSVMSASILFRSNRKTVEFREKIEALGGTIEPLPEDSFKESGTNVNTCLLNVDLN